MDTLPKIKEIQKWHSRKIQIEFKKLLSRVDGWKSTAECHAKETEEQREAVRQMRRKLDNREKIELNADGRIEELKGVLDKAAQEIHDANEGQERLNRQVLRVYGVTGLGLVQGSEPLPFENDPGFYDCKYHRPIHQEIDRVKNAPSNFDDDGTPLR